MKEVVQQFGYERMFYVLAPLLALQRGEGQRLERQHGHEPVRVLAPGPRQEVRGNLDHIVGPAGAVRFSCSLKPLQDVCGLRFNVCRLEGLSQQMFMPCITHKYIQEAGVASRDKIGHISPSIFKYDRDCPRPRLVILGHAALMLHSLHSVG